MSEGICDCQFPIADLRLSQVIAEDWQKKQSAIGNRQLEM
jgi:hypothetical protein